MGSRHLLLQSRNASEGGDVAGLGVAYNFRHLTLPPSEFEWAPERTPEWKPEGVHTFGVSAMISGHRRRGLADGEHRVTLRPIRTKPESKARWVPRVPQRAVSTTEDARYWANCLPGSREQFKRGTGGVLATYAIKGTGGLFTQ